MTGGAFLVVPGTCLNGADVAELSVLQKEARRKLTLADKHLWFGPSQGQRSRQDTLKD